MLRIILISKLLWVTASFAEAPASPSTAKPAAAPAPATATTTATAPVAATSPAPAAPAAPVAATSPAPAAETVTAPVTAPPTAEAATSAPAAPATAASPAVAAGAPPAVPETSRAPASEVSLEETAKTKYVPKATVAAVPLIKQPAKNFLVRSVTGKAATADNEVAEVLFTKDFIDFQGLDLFAESPIEWDKSSGKFLYTTNDGRPPFIFLAGAVKSGYDLVLDGTSIDLIDQKFEIKVYLPMEPRVLSMKAFDRTRRMKAYRFTYFWQRPPPEIRFKIREGASIVQKGTPGGQKATDEAAFVQLYAGDHATATVDLDAQKYGQLTFRLYQTPESEKNYDGWGLVLRNSENKVIGQTERTGQPPEFVDWRDIGNNIVSRGTYTYQHTLIIEGKKYEGPVNSFDAVEGLSVLHHRYSPEFTFEPKEELGYFSYSDPVKSYSNMYVGADLSLAYLNRFVVRGAGNVALYTIDPDQVYTYTRIGAGLRFHGQGSNALFGDPYMYRIDIVLNTTAFTLRPSAPLTRVSQASVLLEPHLILKGYHYIVPWVELGLQSASNQQRLSMGINYFFYIRPWSVKLGLGVANDSMTGSPLAEMNFSIFRAMTNFVFYL